MTWTKSERSITFCVAMIDPEDDGNEYQRITNNTTQENVRVKMPGAVCTEVYKALRMRHLNMPTVFDVME